MSESMGTPGPGAWLRLLVRGWRVQTRLMSSSYFWLLLSVVQPVIYATLAFYLFRFGGRPIELGYAAIGAGMLSLWHTTLVGSGQALTFLRTAGMLELLVASPAPFVFVVAPTTLATATVGLYSLAVTFGWGVLLFGVPLTVAHPLILLLAVPATVFSLGMFGTVLGATFIRFRYANALTNVLLYPIWLVSGILVPPAFLPDWVRPLSWVLPTTWGVRAIRESVLGGRPLVATGACVALGVGYLMLGTAAVRTFERLARREATLALA